MPRLLESWRHIVPGYLYSDPVTPYYYGHETMVCAVCLSIFFMNSWYGQIASSDIRVLAPNSALCHRHAALLPCMVPYWWLTPNIYVLPQVYFSVKVSLVGVFIIHEETNSNKGDPALHLSQVRGYWTDAWVCLHYWVVILVTGHLNPPLYCTVYGVCHRQNTLWP